MLQNQPLRMGIIGVGIIGTTHARRLTSDGSPAELTAVTDLDRSAAAKVVREYGCEAEDSTTALLSRDDIDAVVIATPSGMHADLAVDALEAGKHVFLEKPIEVTLDAADPIVTTAARSEMVLTVASPRRFSPSSQYIREAIQAGRLGRITCATIEVPWWRSQEYYDSAGWRGTWGLDGGGALMNQGVHMVDLALWLLGDVEEVYAHAGLLAHRGIEVEDTITITAKLESGALLSFLATTAAYGDLPIRMSIMGDRGSIVTEDEQIVSHRCAHSNEIPDLKPLDWDGQAMAQLADFAEAVRTGGLPLTTAAEARAAVAFVQAAYESARTGLPVKPSPSRR